MVSGVVFSKAVLFCQFDRPQELRSTSRPTGSNKSLAVRRYSVLRLALNGQQITWKGASELNGLPFTSDFATYGPAPSPGVERSYAVPVAATAIIRNFKMTAPTAGSPDKAASRSFNNLERSVQANSSRDLLTRLSPQFSTATKVFREHV
jgi:hypothetical protein